MKVLIIGGGGREHALAWKLSLSPRVQKIYCAPGNAGTSKLGENVPLAITDGEGLLAFAREQGIDLTVVGPDDALAAGIVDRFQADGRRIFGPTRAAAKLEWSKAFTKDFLTRHDIPTAASGTFDNVADALAFCAGRSYPLVVKADGLAAGKGVVVAETAAEAEAAIRAMLEAGRFGAAGKRLLIEEFLRGRECSLHALLDGHTYRLLPFSQDHKRIGDGDQGENTGGMGTASPPPVPLDDETERRIHAEILAPTVRGLQADGLLFQGLLYPGVMLTADGPRVFEFNSRFGDPETQVLLPRLKSDLLPVLEAVIDGTLDQVPLEWNRRAAVCVILASRGYPGTYETGHLISGLDRVDDPDVLVFHAGTKPGPDGGVVTSGGRVLGVTALGDTLEEARARAYAAAGRITFEGCYCRRDIAAGGALG